MERSTMLLMGKSTMSMAIFNSYVKLPEGKSAGYCGLLTNLLPLGLENESI
jgi:hypothetical protein